MLSRDGMERTNFFMNTNKGEINTGKHLRFGLDIMDEQPANENGRCDRHGAGK